MVVHGGYQPTVIRARTGSPLRLTFDRREDGDCSSRVVFGDLGVNRFLAPFASTVLDLPTDKPGTFEFSCAMNMLHGTLVLEGDPVVLAGTPPAATAAVSPGAADEEAETTARQAELADLARRVVVGAVLTIPVFVAVMAMDLFDATWVPMALMEPWVQLALIAPVMGWVGWPIHRTGWLGLAHRSADMNSLITLGTVAAFGYSLLAHHRAEPAAGRRPRRLLRSGRGDPHADHARPPPRGPRQGRHRRGHQATDRPATHASRTSSATTPRSTFRSTTSSPVTSWPFGRGRRSPSTARCCPGTRPSTSRWSPAKPCRSPRNPVTR